MNIGRLPQFPNEELDRKTGKFSTPLIQRVKALNAEFRFRHSSSSYAEDPVSGRMAQDMSTLGVHCDIIDGTTKQVYATAFARGVDDTAALELAIAVAENTEKPLTPAQRADRAAGRAAAEKAAEAKAERDALAATNADLVAKVAALEAQLAEKPAKTTGRKDDE